MVDDGRGPEAAALWRFRVGPPIEPADKQGARPGALFEQIVRDRRRADLGPLVKNVALEKAALEHANNVCRAGLAAHVLPGGADPSARARRAKYGGVVAENVAIADNVQTAHHDFMWSPSHRRNVLDPLITEVGLGVVRRREKTGLAPSVCVVELFGQGR